ncbi:MAG: hypothetical protein EA394_03830 [Bacteroidia bacterium]|nr:MAG: hypothetical protein EA394_03830 [Bacteroidia bacterium]
MIIHKQHKPARFFCRRGKTRFPCHLFVLLFLILLIAPVKASAQINNNRTSPVIHDTELMAPSPAKAAMLSATFPGLGQVYNRKYWKIPIIYAGFGTLAYFIDFNNTEYRKWREAWIARVDGNPNTVDDYPLYSTDRLEWLMNGYRRNLEVTYILTAALYLLNILDASVDAHLMNFDVGEDLSLGLEPFLHPASLYEGRTKASAQISFRIRF